MAALFFLLVRGAAARVPRLPLYVDPRAIAAAASLPAIAFFTLLTGEAVATERSALMLALGMGALLVGRAASPGPTIAGAALVLLVARPLQLFDVSLQLSVASVAGIALCARRVGAGRTPRPTRSPGGRCAGSGASAPRRSPPRPPPAPLGAHVFGEVAPLAPLGNLALVPLVEMAVVPLGLAGATAAAIWAPLGRWLLRLGGRGRAARAGDRGRLPRPRARLDLPRPERRSRRRCSSPPATLALSPSRRARARRRLLALALAAALVAACEPRRARSRAGASPTP